MDRCPRRQYPELMVNLLHEIWIVSDDNGQLLESCCLAGPDGSGLRELLPPTARLVHTFWAGSHFEAMTLYHRYLGREPYTSHHEWDYSPYPMEWLERQRSGPDSDNTIHRKPRSSR